MERVLYLNCDYCAVAENGRLVEYRPEEKDSSLGDIVLGRVERMMPGMNCAFVEIGREKAGFLPLREKSASFQESSFCSGDRVLVQIRKEAHDGKGAFLSRDLTLAGKTVLLMPMNRHIGISSRITDESMREHLRELGYRLAGNRFGLVMREAAAAAQEETIREEAEALYLRWEELRKRSYALPAPSVAYHEESRAEQLIRDYEHRGITGIIRDESLPADLKRQLRQAFRRRVELPHGGNIVLDRCEAMTVIDVNSASDGGLGGGSRNAGGKRERETALETNLEACREIAVQVRLRNLSGIILIDLINMQEEEDQRLALDTLASAFSADRVKTVIHGLTSLGLVEMTRKRMEPDLYFQQTETCPVCGGSGFVIRKGEET